MKVTGSVKVVSPSTLEAGKVAAGHIHTCPVAPREGSLGEGLRLDHSRARELRMAMRGGEMVTLTPMV